VRYVVFIIQFIILLWIVGFDGINLFDNNNTNTNSAIIICYDRRTTNISGRYHPRTYISSKRSISHYSRSV
jgi:hypothetical protein